MKKIATSLILTFALALSPWAKNKKDDRLKHKETSAEEMSAAGALAATIVVAGVYLVRRRAK
jgi:hypothetical protein